MSEAQLQVEDVVNTLPAEGAWGAFKVLGVEKARLELFGWVLGKAVEVDRVEVLAAGSVIATTAPGVPREDLAKLHPERESAATCGFRVVIEAKGKGKSELQLRAVLEDETVVPMGSVHVNAPARRWDVFRRR